VSTPRLVQAFYDRIWNNEDFGAIPELLAEEFAFRGSLGSELHGHEAFVQYVRSVRGSLSNYRCQILDCVSEGDQAFARMRFCGLHTGPFRGYAPTGRLVSWDGAAFFRFEEGVIAELWVLGDLAGLDRVLRQNAAAGAAEELLLRETRREDLEGICEMEQGEARQFIIPYSLDRHQTEFARPDVVYKSILLDGKHIGYLILVLDADGQSVELRRIVMGTPGRGYGKKALSMVDAICRDELGRVRVWLDVFETNERARHVYESCGYHRFEKSEQEGRTLLLYEKAV
jgi:predicted ester cyclase